MKFYTLLTGVLFALTMAACEKEEEPDPKSTESPEVVRQQISEDLVKQENISVFVEAFEALELKEEDIEEGITIFAPANEGLEGADNARVLQPTADSAGFTEETLRDHIVRGVTQAGGLQDGDTLITLNGKQLLVTVDGDEIRINGVLLTDRNIASNARYTVHTVAQILPNTPPVEEIEPAIQITVWNGAKWMEDKPKGETEEGVTVSLYHSQEDYVQANEPAFTQQTQAGGIAIFQDIEPGKTYYVVAQKDKMSNLFHVSQTMDGSLQGMHPEGIFQSVAEIEAHAAQPDAKPGNFKWTDQNGDGVIDNNDFAPVPYKTVTVDNNQALEVEITIGFDNNYTMGHIKTEAAALDFLESTYLGLDIFQKDLVLLDGLLSDDAACQGHYCEVDNFQIQPNHEVIFRIWSRSYGTISQLNRIMRDLPALSFTGKEEVLAQAKGLRAYIYLQLVTYFGDIPLQAGTELAQDTERTDRGEVYNLIIADLTEVVDVLPATWPSGRNYQLSQGAVRALLAKANLWTKDYQAVSDYTGNIVSSGNYQLMQNPEAVFATDDNAEIIWDFSFEPAAAPLGLFYNAYFSKGSFCPAMRLTEVYLMDAEAKFELQMTEPGINSLNAVRMVSGLAEVDPTLSIEELKEALRVTWKTAMALEGNRFANLVRWEKANEVLGQLGYQDHHALLPISQAFIDKHYNLMQNPGY